MRESGRRLPVALVCRRDGIYCILCERKVADAGDTMKAIKHFADYHFKPAMEGGR